MGFSRVSSAVSLWVNSNGFSGNVSNVIIRQKYLLVKDIYTFEQKISKNILMFLLIFSPEA